MLRGKHNGLPRSVCGQTADDRFVPAPSAGHRWMADGPPKTIGVATIAVIVHTQVASGPARRSWKSPCTHRPSPSSSAVCGIRPRLLHWCYCRWLLVVAQSGNILGVLRFINILYKYKKMGGSTPSSWLRHWLLVTWRGLNWRPKFGIMWLL